MPSVYNWFFVRIEGRKKFHGRVAEWPIAPVLKTGNPQGFVGSNPTSSANLGNGFPSRGFVEVNPCFQENSIFGN